MINALASSSWASHADWLTRLARFGVRLPCSSEELVGLLGWLHRHREVPYANSSIRGMLSAVHRFHVTLGIPSPRESWMVGQAVAGYAAYARQALVARSVGTSSGGQEAVMEDHRVDPMGPHVISAVLRGPALLDPRKESYAVMMVLAYLWGFRPKTIAGFRVGDVDVGDSVTRLQVAWEKTTRKSTDQVLRSVTVKSNLSDGPAAKFLTRLRAVVQHRLVSEGAPLTAPLFVDSAGRGLNTQKLSVIVKNLVAHVLDSYPGVCAVEPSRDITASSFRSGAAVSLVCLGYSDDQIASRRALNWAPSSRDKMVKTYDRYRSGTAAGVTNHLMADSVMAGIWKAIIGVPEVAQVPLVPLALL